MSQTKVQLVDLNGLEAIIDADADTSITADTDDQIDFKIGGNDTIVINAQGSTPLMQINAGASNNNLYIASTDATSGISLSDNGGSINLATTSSGAFRVMTGGTADTAADDSAISMLIDANGKIATGGETAPDCDAGGLTLDQNANDNKILTLKSSDVAHGMTDFAETDTYAVFEKVSAGSGGLRVEAFMETISAIAIRSFHVNENTTQASSGSDAAILIDSCVKNGTTVTGNSDSANMVCFRDNTIPRVFITGDGDVFSDRAFSDNAFDHYNDAHLVRAFDLSTENKNGVIDSKFDDFIKYNAQKLADLKILGKNTDGTPSTFVNINGLQRLHNGAIWQQYEKHQRLASAFYKLAEKTIGKEEADKLLTEEEIQLLN